ncbi:MAG: ComF family protein [Candidatus Moraniibacteriota bacterium]
MERSSPTSFFVRLKGVIVDALFPIVCLGCSREGQFICDSCRDRIPERDSQECPICRVPYSPNGAVCKKCRRKTALDGLLIAVPYKNRLIERAIHTFKYRFIENLAFSLASLIERALAHNSLPLPDAILPVPLHPRRLRYRGFNQAKLLSDALAQDLTPQLEIPILDALLVRTRFTKPQIETKTREERLQNLSGAFAIADENKNSLAGKYVWLVDDVATTGSTLEECAKALKLAGARSVWGIVVAR